MNPSKEAIEAVMSETAHYHAGSTEIACGSEVCWADALRVAYAIDLAGVQRETLHKSPGLPGSADDDIPSWQKIERLQQQLSDTQTSWQKLAAALEQQLSAAQAEIERLKRLVPTHGNCCTCQQCGKHHDDCRCDFDEVLAQRDQLRQELTLARKPWTVTLALSTTDRLNCVVVDVGHSDRVLVVECPELQQEVERLKGELQDSDYELRKALWIGHGCDGVYGDDGELQCNNISLHGQPLDFKRMPLDELRRGILVGNLARLKENREN